MVAATAAAIRAARRGRCVHGEGEENTPEEEEEGDTKMEEDNSDEKLLSIPRRQR